MKNAENFILKGDIAYCDDFRNLVTAENGYLICENDKSKGVYKTIEDMPEKYQSAPLKDFSGHLIIPGLTDLHTHAPQYAFRGLGMDMELLEWLSKEAFAEESKYSDPDYAQKAYHIFADDISRTETCHAVIFGTMHPESTLILMKEMEKSGIKSMVGKVNMDRNCPDNLREISSSASLSATCQWIKAAKKLNLKNVTPIITPRFLPSCSDELMKGLAVIAEREKLPLQSHLSENLSEISWVKELCPHSTSYGNAYDSFRIFGSQGLTVMAHCVWSSEEEVNLIKKNNIYIAHCPSSNMNLSSGIAPVRYYLDKGIHVGLGSDIAAGHTLSMFDAMKEAIQVSKIYWRYIDSAMKPLTFREVFYMATKEGGSFFGKRGSLEADYSFDVLVLDESKAMPLSKISISERIERAIYLAEDMKILHKYVDGEMIF